LDNLYKPRKAQPFVSGYKTIAQATNRRWDTRYQLGQHVIKTLLPASIGGQQ